MVLSEKYCKTQRFWPLGAPKRARFLDTFGVLFGDHFGLHFQVHPDLSETLRTQKLYAIISPGPAPRRRRVKFSISPDGPEELYAIIISPGPAQRRRRVKFSISPDGLEKSYAISNKPGAGPAPEARKVFNKSGWPQKTLRNK